MLILKKIQFGPPRILGIYFRSMFIFYCLCTLQAAVKDLLGLKNNRGTLSEVHLKLYIKHFCTVPSSGFEQTLPHRFDLSAAVWLLVSLTVPANYI